MWIGIAILSVGLLTQESQKPQGAKSGSAKTQVNVAIERVVIQAIEDEIYDWGCQNSVDLVAVEISPGKFQLPLYINPVISEGRGEVIYKFMPIGELYRSFFSQADGLVQLDDDPGHGFGAERTSRNTLFMEDDFICAAKHDWLKRHFVIDGHPSLARVAQAQARERKRLGDAYYPHRNPAICEMARGGADLGGRES